MVHSSPLVWVDRSISSVGVTVVVNNVVLHVLFLMDALIIILITVGKLIGVWLSHLNIIGTAASLFLVSKLVSLLVVLLSKVHLGIELDLPLLNEAVVVNDIVKGIALVLELFVLSFVSIGNFVGRKLLVLVLELEHHSIFKSHVLLLELKLPLLNESIIISNIIIRVVLIFKFLILSLISVTNFVGWELLRD